MTFTIDEEDFNENYKYSKVRGYLPYDGRYVENEDGDLVKEEIERTYIVYNQTLTPNEGGDKAIYRECETESEAIAIVRMLNSIFTSFVTVDFDMDEEDMQDETIEETMTYEHVLVQWAYA